MNLFIDYEKIKKERDLEKTLAILKQKVGKNKILRGMSLEDGATAVIRNTLIGGHNA